MKPTPNSHNDSPTFSPLTHQKKSQASSVLFLITSVILALTLTSCMTTKEAEDLLTKKNSTPLKEKEVGPILTDSLPEKELGVVSEEELQAGAEAIDNTVQEIAPAAAEEEPIKYKAPTAVSSAELSALERRVRIALARDQYQRAISLTENPKTGRLTYYRGIAFFALSLNVADYNSAERKKFSQNSEIFLTRVEKNQEYGKEIRAKALFWYGISVDIVAKKNSEKRRSLVIFEELRKKYPNSPVYSDSLFYSGIINYQLEQYEKSQDFFNTLSKFSAKTDTRVYDRITKKYFRQSNAAKLGETRLKNYRKKFSRN